MAGIMHIQFTLREGEIQILLNGMPLTDLFTVLTFLLLIITIFISIRALKETARSNILSSSPVLLLSYQKKSRGINIENVGSSAALDIRIDNYYLSFVNDLPIINARTGKVAPNKPTHAVLRYDPIDILLAKESKDPETTRSKGDGAFITPDVLEHHFMNNGNNIIFHIRYSDISGIRYISKISISKKKIKVAGHPKKYNVYRKFLYFIHLIIERCMLLAFRTIAHYKQIKWNREMQKKYDKEIR